MEGLKQFRKSPRQHRQHTYRQLWAIDQDTIGWENFLSGLMHQHLINRQQEHYREIGSRKGATRWAANIILQVWSITRNMWLGRCSAQHKKSIIHTTISDHLLDIEIEKEYDEGCANLPEGIRKWFCPTKEFILGQSQQYKRGWLLIIRSTKESLQIAEYISIFSSSQTLRRWIGFNG